MRNEKIILAVEATVLPQFLDEVTATAKAALSLTLAEIGCEAFFQSSVQGEPNKLLFFEVFASEAAHEFHLQQEYTKQVFSTLRGKLAGEPTVTHLREI